MASAAAVSVSADPPVDSSFIELVHLDGRNLAGLASVQYTIVPKPGTASKPVHVTYSIAALQRQGYAVAGSSSVALPVFGLYAGYANQVAVQLTFRDGSVSSQLVVVTMPVYTDPNGIYDHPTVIKARAPGSALGFDFFAIKSALGSPVIMDSDGEIRWIAPGISDSFSSNFQDNAFVIGDPVSSAFWRLGLDGSIQASAIGSAIVTSFHHNIDIGKTGLLADINAVSGGVSNVESTLVEFDPTTGNVISEWDLAAILSSYMLSQGDDPSQFVRPGLDWFHMNSAIYDPRDDSIIVSSRENFVIKIDYASGTVKWILGDPTKYWYTFPSLRAKALQMQGGGLVPVGQHALSITSDGLLMLFNDGLGSGQQPAGAPAGITRTYSAVSAYSIDPVARTATEVWDFNDGQSIYSAICSSAYEANGGSILVDYAYASGGTTSRLVGLDANHGVVFDFQLANTGCNTAWNSIPIPLEDLRFD